MKITVQFNIGIYNLTCTKEKKNIIAKWCHRYSSIRSHVKQVDSLPLFDLLCYSLCIKTCNL